MTPDRSTLRESLSVLRRRKWTALLAVVAVPAAVVGLSMLQEPMYSASAQVLLSHQNLANSLNNVLDPSLSLDPQRLSQTQVNIAETPQVAAGVLRAARLHDRTPQQFLASASVSARTDSDLLVFSVTDRSSKLAAKLATLFASQYLSYADQLATRTLGRARIEVETKIAQLEEKGDRRSALYADLVSKDEQLATMEALQTGTAVLLRSAQGSQQVQPQPVRNGLLGLMLGLVLGIGLAFLRDHLDTRVRTSAEVSHHLGLPVLARLPRPPRTLRRRRQLAVLQSPTSTDAEPFRVLCTNFEFTNLDLGARTIMVTSAREGEGKSTTAANLALAMASTGRHVALVDLDLRRPFLHQFFQIPAAQGLTNLVLGDTTMDDALVPILLDDESMSTLEVMASGPVPPNPAEFIRSRGVATVLDGLAARFETVVIDAAPLLGVGDSLALTSQVDALVLVARLELLRRPVLDELRRVLDGCPTKPLGVVITAAERERGYGYDYGYGYGYGHGYGHGQASNGRAAAARLVPQRIKELR